jgi:hypothetical protein
MYVCMYASVCEFFCLFKYVHIANGYIHAYVCMRVCRTQCVCGIYARIIVDEYVLLCVCVCGIYARISVYMPRTKCV